MTEFLQDDVVTLDIFADGTPIPRDGIEVVRGENTRIDVVVRTRGGRAPFSNWHD